MILLEDKLPVYRIGGGSAFDQCNVKKEPFRAICIIYLIVPFSCLGDIH